MFRYIEERNIKVFFIVPVVVFRKNYLKYVNMSKAGMVRSHGFTFHSGEQHRSGVLQERRKRCSIINNSMA